MHRGAKYWIWIGLVVVEALGVLTILVGSVFFSIDLHWLELVIAALLVTSPLFGVTRPTSFRRRAS
jgi:hypothetical protein